MKPFTRTTIFILSSNPTFLKPTTIPKINLQTFIKISHFSTTQNPPHPSQISSFQSRRHEEESRNVRVSVWWDIENCALPADFNVFKASQSITAAIRVNGIRGPIQITAFGDVLKLSRSNQEALSSTGINLNHIPNGGKDRLDRSLLVDLMYWVSQNPPPAHLFIISGDRDFASILHRLRMNNYNILLATPDPAPSVLCSAASIMWQWNDLIKGVNMNGKHFNQPPDGPYGSWYGHYVLPLDDPFAINENQSSAKAADHSEYGPVPAIRPIPNAVIRQIHLILDSHPRGISMSGLYMELHKNVTVDRDFYGYKRFSRFLLSLPQIVKIQTGIDGQVLVHRVGPTVTETSESSPDEKPSESSSPSMEEQQKKLAVPINSGSESSTRVAPYEKPSVFSSPKKGKPMKKEPGPTCDRPESSGGEPDDKRSVSPTKIEKPLKKEPGPTLFIEPVNESKEIEKPLKKEPGPTLFIEPVNENTEIVSNLQHVEEQDPTISEAGFFRRIWRNLFGSKEKDSNSTQFEEDKEKSDKTHVQFTSEDGDTVGPGSISKAVNDKTGNDVIDDSTSKDPGIFENIMKWCTFWRSTQPLEDPSENSEKVEGTKIDNEKNELFSTESFWAEILEFIDSAKGKELVLQSRTRKHLAENLQIQGPPILKTLNETDLLHLIDLLISSNKKRVKESPSKRFPFEFIKPVPEHSSTNPPTSNSTHSPTSSQSPKGDIIDQILSHTGVSPAKNPTPKSIEETLSDCQKLVDEMLKEYPDGFNMNIFRKTFVDKYGYPLDLAKMGHKKVATLLQTLSGVQIELSYIIPSSKHPLGSKLPCEKSRKYKDSDLSDSQWEELGPISGSGQNETMRGLIGEEPRYEPLSDCVTSDSDDEAPTVVGPQSKEKVRMNEEDSSLLQILDSWYGSQEESNNKPVACEKNDINLKQLPPLSETGPNGENPSVSNDPKQTKHKPSRSYTFVADQNCDADNTGKQDKLVDGILGSLKKNSNQSSEATSQS